MSSTTSKENRRPPAKSPASLGTKSRSPTRPSESTTATPNGPPRARTAKPASSTPLSARAAAKRSSVIVPDSNYPQDEEDARMESAALIDDLKSQLRKAEIASEEYQKQIYILQARCDEAIGDQSKLEDARNESLQKIELMQDEQKEHLRIHRDLEKALETEKAASIREKEDGLAREEELSGIIQRLKESLSQREHHNGSDNETRLSRAASFRGRSSGQIDSSPLGRDAVDKRESSQNSAKLVMQKDKLIESLRLELAEAQIRVMEVERAGGGRLQDLEKTLMDTRIANAKLMEDNESYQVLLQEKTLNGDFSRFLRPPSVDERQTSSANPKRTSLAQELETAVLDSDAEVDPDTERLRKLEAENVSLKEQSKALTLYINNIITRLLQNDKFESLFDTTETEVGLENPSNPIGTANAGKPLPEPPAEEKETVTQSLLSRAGSVFGRQRPRPQSIQSQSAATTLTGSKPANNSTSRGDSIETTPERRASGRSPLPNPIENPLTAPSIPLKPVPGTATRHVRNSSSGSRPRQPISEISQQHHASSIVNNMYRGPPPTSTGQLSPSGLASPRQTPFFAGPPPPPLFSDGSSLDDPSASTSRVGSTSDPASAAASTTEAASSPPRSAAASSSDAGPRSQTGGAIFGGGGSGNKMRPLRLVREKVEADEAAEAERKRNNRQSFMGWFSGMGGGILGQTQGGQDASDEDRLRNVIGPSSSGANSGIRRTSET